MEKTAMPRQDASFDTLRSYRLSSRLLASALFGLLGMALGWPEPLPAAPGDATTASFQEPEAPSGKTIQVVAIVNGEDIARQELAQDCLKLYGKEVLESLVN